MRRKREPDTVMDDARVAVESVEEREPDAPDDPPSATVTPAPAAGAGLVAFGAALDAVRAVAPTLEHFHMTVAGHFWYETASRRILDALPTDRPTQWVEVGVFQGQSLAWLGVEVVNRGLPVTIHAVDTFAGWQGTLNGAALRAAFDKTMAPIAEALGDRLQVHAVASVDAAKSFPDRSLDVVWLDADHSYEAVKADIKAWLPKIRSSGTLGGDDWEMGGVAKAVKEAFPSSHTIGEGRRHSARWPWWMVKV